MAARVLQLFQRLWRRHRNNHRLDGAAWISVRLGRNQAAIAQSQANIARDKLKFDLFEMRYGIYSSVKELIEYATGANPDAPIDTSRVRNLYVKLDKSRFFFDAGVIAFIKDVCAAAEAYYRICEASERLQIPMTLRIGLG